MPNKDFILKLPQMEGFKIKNIVGTTLTMQLPVKQHSCSICASNTNIKDYRLQKIKHLSIPGTKYTVFINKRHCQCPHCKKTFYEKNRLLTKYKSMTTPLRKYIMSQLTELKSMKQIAHVSNVSVFSVCTIIDSIDMPKPSVLPEVISIDEFKGNTDGYKFQCILIAPQTKKIIDILPTRKSEELYAYKVLKRISFGVRNFNRFRKRLLFIANCKESARTCLAD